MTMDTEQITVVQSAGTPAPRVSVLMAAHNGNAFIGYTLHSILAQRFSDFEVVIVDDASIDGTADVVRGFDDKRIRLISTPRNMGPPGARNVGYAACRGEYIAPVDQDDLWLPLRLARQVAYLDRHDEAALVATATDRLVDGKRLASPEPVRTSPGFLRWALMTGNPLVWSSVMIRRASLHAAGGPFNREDRRFAEDFDLYHRLQRVGTIGRIDEVLTTYRSHAAGASRVFGDKMMASAIRVLEDAYEPILGANASRAAQAMARHVGGGEPVPDMKTLQLVQAVLQAMTQYVKASHSVDEVARVLVATEREALLRRVVRAALRGGGVSVRALRSAEMLHLADLGTGALMRNSVLGLLRGTAPQHAAATRPAPAMRVVAAGR